MSKGDRIFFSVWGAVLFPLVIIACTVACKWNASIIIPSLLTFMGGIKFLLEKDANCQNSP